MTRAKEAGVSYEDAAVAFGCNPDTMRKHYVALHEVSVSDRVMEAIQGPSEFPESAASTTSNPSPPRTIGESSRRDAN